MPAERSTRVDTDFGIACINKIIALSQNTLKDKNENAFPDIKI